MKTGTKRKIILLLSVVNLKNLGEHIKAGVNNACSSCDITISSDVSNLVVPSGKTVCVLPNVRITGTLTINNNGTLCNQGAIEVNNLNAGNNITVYNYGDFSVSNAENWKQTAA